MSKSIKIIALVFFFVAALIAAALLGVNHSLNTPCNENKELVLNTEAREEFKTLIDGFKRNNWRGLLIGEDGSLTFNDETKELTEFIRTHFEMSSMVSVRFLNDDHIYNTRVLDSKNFIKIGYSRNFLVYKISESYQVNKLEDSKFTVEFEDELFRVFCEL